MPRKSVVKIAEVKEENEIDSSAAEDDTGTSNSDSDHSGKENIVNFFNY